MYEKDKELLANISEQLTQEKFMALPTGQMVQTECDKKIHDYQKGGLGRPEMPKSWHELKGTWNKTEEL